MSRNARKNEDPILHALVAGKTIRESAEAANVDEKTIRRHLRDPKFVARLSEMRGEVTRAVLDRMVSASIAAVDELRKLLTAASENVRLGACRTILELGVKLRDAGELAEKVRELEKLLGEDTNVQPET